MILNMSLNKLLVIFKQPPAKPEKEPISLCPHTQAAADFRGLVQRETVVRESAFSNVEEFSYMCSAQQSMGDVVLQRPLSSTMGITLQY